MAVIFADINSRFIFNLFVECALLVTQYSRITFVNNGESENSNDKRSVFVPICVSSTCMACISLAFRVRVGLGCGLGEDPKL